MLADAGDTLLIVAIVTPLIIFLIAIVFIRWIFMIETRYKLLKSIDGKLGQLIAQGQQVPVIKAVPPKEPSTPIVTVQPKTEANITAICPHCQADYKVPQIAVGKNAKCPKCEMRFVVN